MTTPHEDLTQYVVLVFAELQHKDRYPVFTQIATDAMHKGPSELIRLSRHLGVFLTGCWRAGVSPLDAAREVEQSAVVAQSDVYAEWLRDLPVEGTPS